MGCSEWEELLERRLAYLPGSKDTAGAPLLIIPLPQDTSHHDVGGISATLKYLKNIPSLSCRDRGWVVIVDARSCPYRLVKPTVSTIRATLGNIKSLFVVKLEGFWEKQRVDCRKSEIDSQPIVVSVGKLTKHIESAQLPVELGGTLKYDHSRWVSSRKLYEEFIDECERTKRDLESLQSELRREEPCSRASTLQDLLKVNVTTYQTITSRPPVVLKTGEEVLHALEMDEESGFRMSDTPGFSDEACKRVRSLTEEVNLILMAVQSSWKRLQSTLDMHHEVQGLESEMNDVANWLASAGQTLLGETRIGINVSETESLLREHEAIELKCRETYARWARLRYRVGEALERGDGELKSLADHEVATSNLRSLRDYTDTLVRSFASRLDRRRTLILASVRFHRIVSQLEHRCSILLKEEKWTPQIEDSSQLQKTTRELTARKEAIDYLAHEGTHSGEKLLDLLTVGVKDLSGRDVTPDYTKELNHVHKLLHEVHELYVKTVQQADIAKLRLQQAAQLLTCHQDLKQAQQWLHALLEVLVRSHSHVGRTVEEIRCLKTEHQQFQDTATCTFEYGYECAKAALLVQKSGGSRIPADSHKLVARLEDTWKMFIEGSQEQLTRLRVAGIFFRTMEQHLSRLETLCSNFKGRPKNQAVIDDDVKKLLSARERLMKEIGRNVRLGKLLKKRLKEPLISFFSETPPNENAPAQEAITERIGYITSRARYLDGLMIPLTQASAVPTDPQPIPNTLTPPSSPPTDLPDGSKSHTGHHTEDQEGDYWSCSDAGSADTYYTCPEWQDLRNLFGSFNTTSDDELTLEEVLDSRPSTRRKYRSRSLSPKETRSRSRSRSRKSRSRSEERHAISSSHADNELPPTYSHERLTRTQSYPKGKREGPKIHPDGLGRARKSPSRSNLLTKEIVESFLLFKDKVTERSPSKSRSRSTSRTPDHTKELEVEEKLSMEDEATQLLEEQKDSHKTDIETISAEDLIETDIGPSLEDSSIEKLNVSTELKRSADEFGLTVDSMSSGFEDMAHSLDSTLHGGSHVSTRSVLSEPVYPSLQYCQSDFEDKDSQKMETDKQEPDNTTTETITTITDHIKEDKMIDVPDNEHKSLDILENFEPENYFASQPTFATSTPPSLSPTNAKSSLTMISNAPFSSSLLEEKTGVNECKTTNDTISSYNETKERSNIFDKVDIPSKIQDIKNEVCSDRYSVKLSDPDITTLDISNSLCKRDTFETNEADITDDEDDIPVIPALPKETIENLATIYAQMNLLPTSDNGQDNLTTSPKPEIRSTSPEEFIESHPILEYQFNKGPLPTIIEMSPPPDEPSLQQTECQALASENIDHLERSYNFGNRDQDIEAYREPLLKLLQKLSADDYDNEHLSLDTSSMSDIVVNADDGRTSAGAVSRASAATSTTTGNASTTTISTIAVQSGDTRIVLALLQSAEWLELRVVELHPGLAFLGGNLEEALTLQKAHQEVLTKLQGKQSPVEDLLNQADQLIATQRPKAEVYAAMAESLGLAWRDLNAHLETRKMLLDLSVSFHSKAHQYSQAMDSAEKSYTDNVMPSDSEGVRKLLLSLQDHKRAILESSMFTLQEAKVLLGKLRGLLQDGGSMDSRPQHIRTSIEFACSQIEHYLETLHDRRRFLDGIFTARKHHLEQCLSLCLLYQELTNAVLKLKELRDEISRNQNLGDSQSNAEILLHEHLKREALAKNQQDQCVKLVKTAEQMVSVGHYAGTEPRARAYSVLEAATALHETCDTRTALLEQAALFFKLANTALTKLDQAEVQVAALASGGSQRLSVVIGVVEEAIQPALTEGYAILEVTGGRGRPHNQGITNMVEQLENRRLNMNSLCEKSTEKALHRTELVNCFLEQYNSIESWLIKIGDSFLQGHQDPGASLSLAKDFLHLHQTLSSDIDDKKNNIEALLKFLGEIEKEIPEEDFENYQKKMQGLTDHWKLLRLTIDNRISLSDLYVEFHQEAENLQSKFDHLESLLKSATTVDDGIRIEDEWNNISKLYQSLQALGKDFCKSAETTEDPTLDVNRAVLCVKTILENFGKRKLVISDLHSHFQMKITANQQLTALWKTYRENLQKMNKEMANVEEALCPLLRGDPNDPEELGSSLEYRLNHFVNALKKIQEGIETMVTKAEGHAFKEDCGEERAEIVKSLLKLYQNLQNKVTDYQVLGTILCQWCKNVAEIHKSCDKLENQFGLVSTDPSHVEVQIKENEASKQAVTELINFAHNEAKVIIAKIKTQCPPKAGEQDIATMDKMLERRKRALDTIFTNKQTKLEKQWRRSQYQVDLQAISNQLRDLSEQLNRMKGHYGDCLSAAENMKSSFVQFTSTVDMLEARIKDFVSTSEKILLAEDDSGEIRIELAELLKKWGNFQKQVEQSQKNIDISIDYFKLVHEAEEWFKKGSQLLVNVSEETSTVTTPEQAVKLRQKIENFLHPGEDEQADRMQNIVMLATLLYGDTAPKLVENVSQQNQYMKENFAAIDKNILTLVENLKKVQEQKLKQDEEQRQLAESLAAAQKEAEEAKLAAEEAELARRQAEEAVRAMSPITQSTCEEKVETIVQTELHKQSAVPKGSPPEFLTPLIGASVSEGVKFTFECKVHGDPTPKVHWLKDGLSIMNNPDYKTLHEDCVCSLTIEETFTEDSALFTCKAENDFGTAETSASLSVKEAPPVEPYVPPMFTKRLSNQTAMAGNSLQLDCTVTGHPLPVVSWFKNNQNIDNSSDYVITYNNGQCTLRFEELFIEDMADYSCKAVNELGEDITKCVVTVNSQISTEKPVFSAPLSNVMARAGQKFKLECQITANPAPTVAWFHNSKPIKESPDCKIQFDGTKASLHISEAFPKNSGIYSVVAKNAAGETQSSSTVSVKGRIPTETSDSEITSDVDIEPVKPSIQLALKDTVVREGKPARLDCVIVGQPEPEVIWYHDDKPVKESEDFKLLFHGDRCSLVIQEVYEEDVGIYRVVAMNSAGEASTACFLNVEAAPVTVAPRFIDLLCDSHAEENDSVKLFVRVEGQPMPTVEWRHDGTPVNKETTQAFDDGEGYASLDIPKANLDHTGQYEAIATNSAGTAKSAAFLSIEPYLPPKKGSPPIIMKHLQTSVVQAGEPLTLEVKVESDDKPRVSWNINDFRLTGTEYQNGVRQYFFDEHSSGIFQLHMPSISMVQAGTVTFVAENDAGKAVSSAELQVLDHTEPSTGDFTNSVISEQHVTHIISSSTIDEKGPQHKTFSSDQKSYISSATGEPTKEVYESKVEQNIQKSGKPAQFSEKIGIVKLEDKKVIEEIREEKISTPPSTPTTPIKKAIRKATPARFITPLQGVIAKEDDAVELQGVIDGFPQPEVVWTHNGGPLPADAIGSVSLNKVTLQIGKVSQDHSGRYTCSLDNEAGSAECTCDIVVKKTQFPPVFSKRLQPSVLPVGSRLHLEVDVSGTPPPTVEWTKNGQPLKSTDDLLIKGERTRHYIVKQKVEASDSGRYGVAATNPAGRSECLADVLVSDLVPQETSTRRIVYTNVTDDARNESNQSVEGTVNETKQQIFEAKASEQTCTSSFEHPISAPVIPNPIIPTSETENLPTEPENLTTEPTVCEEEPLEPKKPPGKLNLIWPPPASDIDNIPTKINPLDDISKDTVSSAVNIFDEIAENEAIEAAANALKPRLSIYSEKGINPTSDISTLAESEVCESTMDQSRENSGAVLMEVKTEKHVKESSISEVKTTISSSEQTIVETKVYRDYDDKHMNSDGSALPPHKEVIEYPPLISQISLPIGNTSTSVTSSSEIKMSSQQREAGTEEVSQSAQQLPESQESIAKKKKRESVKQIAMRLEENIAPLTPEEVPCGVRIFPTPLAVAPKKKEPEIEQPKEDSSFRPFPKLEPFPFEIETKSTTQREKVPPPPTPKKFIPGATLTDSEYDSDFDAGSMDRKTIKKVNFDVQFKEKQPIKPADPAPPPPFDLQPPPTVVGMRPKIDFASTKTEEVVVKKEVTPKKTPKIVEKFFAKSGVSSESQLEPPAPVAPVSSKVTKKPIQPFPALVPPAVSEIVCAGTSETLIESQAVIHSPLELHPPVASKPVPAQPLRPTFQNITEVTPDTLGSNLGQYDSQSVDQRSTMQSSNFVRKEMKTMRQSNRVSWPQNNMNIEESQPIASWVKGRTQSLERPKRTTVVEPLSKEAPATIFWSSNISLTEKSKTPQYVVPEFTHERMVIHKAQDSSSTQQFVNPLSVPKPVQISKPAIKKTNEKKLTSIEQYKNDLNVQFKQIPQCEPFPFKVEENRPYKRESGPPPSKPTKFIPGTFAETDYESDYEGRPPSFWRPYASDTETAEYRPLRMKLKQGRMRHQKQKSPPAPPHFERPPPLRNEWRPVIDYESDIPTSREHSPVRQVLSHLKSKVTYKESPMPLPTQTSAPKTQARVSHQPFVKPSSYSGIVSSQKPMATYERETAPTKPIGYIQAPINYDSSIQSQLQSGYTVSTAPATSIVYNAPVQVALPTQPVEIASQPAFDANAGKVQQYSFLKRDLEESGYAADTESTLPRRAVKSHASSSSFSKTESFVSSSSTKKEMKSFQSSTSQFCGQAPIKESSQMVDIQSNFTSDPHIPFNPTSSFPGPSQSSSSFMSQENKSSQMHTTRTEETKEEYINGNYNANEKIRSETKPKFQEYRKETKGTPGGDNPYSEKQFYSMSDASEVITDSGKKKSKIFMKSESSKSVQSDKKSEYYSYSSKVPEDVHRNKFESFDNQNKEPYKKVQKRTTATSTDDSPMQRVTSRSRETQTDSEFEDKSSVPSSPLAKRSELKSIGLVRKATEDGMSGKTAPRTHSSSRTPHSQSSFVPSQYEPSTQPKVEFVDSSTEPKVTKAPSTLAKSNIQPETVGVESTRTLHMKDEGAQHRRFISMQQTTKVIKLNTVETQNKINPVHVVGSYKMDMPELKPFPFKPDPEKPRRKKHSPPPTPKKFYKANMRESDYESDFDERIKPKWKPDQSEADHPSYTPIQTPLVQKSKQYQRHERTPTPPFVFDKNPPVGGPMRPIVDHFQPNEEEYRSEAQKLFGVNPQTPSTQLRPGTPPEEGMIVERVDYVVDKVDLHHKQIPPKMKEVQTYIEKPYKEVIEKTEKKIISKRVHEEQNVKTTTLESVRTTITPTHKMTGTEQPYEYQTKSPVHPSHNIEPPLTKHQKEELVRSAFKPQATELRDPKRIQVDIDITDVYDYAPDSEITTRSEARLEQPNLQPFPFTAEQERPKRERGAPPPTPNKFMKGSFRESDYESDFDSRIQPKWRPTDSESETTTFKRVEPPRIIPKERHHVDKAPSPPSKFDQPPQFEGPPRPLVDLNGIPRRERRESLEEYSVAKFPKVEFKPFELEEGTDSQHPAYSDTNVPGKQISDQNFSVATRDYVGKQFEDLSDTFRAKTQNFADDIVSDVFDNKPDGLEIPGTETNPLENAQSYRDHSRASEFGSKHIDPDTGLIYFKYDFGYEFGILLPGEGKRKKEVESAPEEDSVEIPVAHYYSDDETKSKIRKAAASSRSRKSNLRKGNNGYGVAKTTDDLPDVNDTNRDNQLEKRRILANFVPSQTPFVAIPEDPLCESDLDIHRGENINLSFIDSLNSDSPTNIIKTGPPVPKPKTPYKVPVFIMMTLECMDVE